jgi:hypothetical protein
MATKMFAETSKKPLNILWSLFPKTDDIQKHDYKYCTEHSYILKKFINIGMGRYKTLSFSVHLENLM